MPLNSETFYSNAAIDKKRITFTRDTNDTTSFEDAEIAVVLTPASGTALTLAVNSGLTRTTNTESSQVVDLQISQAQANALLNGRSRQTVEYQFFITPAGAQKLTGAEGSPWYGKFYLKPSP